MFAYQKDLQIIEELTYQEQLNDRDLENADKQLFLKQITLLKQKNEIYNELIYKINTTYPLKSSQKIINVDNLEDILSNNPSPENGANKELEDYIDRLNNNIEMMKKAFQQNADEYDHILQNPDLNESEIPGIDFEEYKVRKSDSPFDLDAKRKFQSVSASKVRDSVGNMLENTSFSITQIYQKVKTYPKRISELEEENAKLKKNVEEFAVKFETIERENIKLMEKLKESETKEAQMQIENAERLKERYAQEQELEDLRRKIRNLEEEKEKNHYLIKHSFGKQENDIRQPLLDENLRKATKKSCCSLY